MRFGTMPRVSVVLATFNRAAHLQAAIESVVAQTFGDWELIVVDDGSTDSTCEVVLPFTERHGNIRYMRHSNRKAALSRNAGMQGAFGDLITFLDSDDLYLPPHLESRIALLESNPEAQLITGGFACDPDTWVRDRHDPERFVHIGECILCGTLFGRRELFCALGGFRDLDYAEDTDLWERAAARFPVLKIDAPHTYVYRRSDDSITRHYRKQPT
jgi:glycosyltransferase involved in cell wall biosynthesis